MNKVKQLHFSILIQASVEHVWQLMFSDVGYRDWTSAFCEGSYYQGNWQQGETMRFLAPSGDGMVSQLEVVKLYEKVAIKHLGFIVQGKEDYDSAEVKSWAPAYESYFFTVTSEGIKLSIEQDIAPEYEQYMQRTWPLALQRLKTLCEVS